ncbi:hypothetical protein FJT64_016184 [Amphibalanus amphitrite]|uniref:Uncharacterized protein n=1 Tax=Amphibalanus amphitrite TaxID=1232801 RepID=A0A6A4XDJ3_AMPAM|nr:hypothetical protein FJT64_016184 [Amphibalanus amphitrite]
MGRQEMACRLSLLARHGTALGSLHGSLPVGHPSCMHGSLPAQHGTALASLQLRGSLPVGYPCPVLHCTAVCQSETCPAGCHNAAG